MKNIFILTIMFAFVITTNAQDLRFGVQASPSFSWMRTDDAQINSNGTALGMKLGLVGEFTFRENYAFTSGLGFFFNSGGTLKHNQGGNLWANSGLKDAAGNPLVLSNGTDLKYKLQYVEIPVGLKLRTQEFGYIRYYAELPIFTFGFKSAAKGNIESSDVGNQEKINIKNEVNAVNISWGLGGGIEYGVSTSTALVAGLYYQNGFTDVTKDGAKRLDNTADNSKGTIGAITLRLGVLF